MDLTAMLILLLTSVVSGTSGQCNGCESPNVRTVLFRQADLLKECWSDEELALLYTRRLMQELIPKKATCKIHMLLEYLKIALETIKEVTCSERSHRLIIMAMADAFGGYLQAYGIPTTKAKYYEGTATYCTTRQMTELQAAFRRTLDTDGGGWTRPAIVKKSLKVQPFKIPELPKSVCTNLVTSSEGNDKCNTCGSRETFHDATIPLPFLDDVTSPRAIAVPFRDRSLYSLFSRNASDILLKYYSIGIRCLSPPAPDDGCTDGTYTKKIDSFVVNYHTWLSRTVVPRLNDEMWYPAFGGVQNILQEMYERGMTLPSPPEDDQDSDFVLKLDDSCECVQTSVWFYAGCVLGLFILFWVIVCLLCFCIKFCGGNYENDYNCTPTSSSSGAVVNTLTSMYCRQSFEGQPCKNPTRSSSRHSIKK